MGHETGTFSQRCGDCDDVCRAVKEADVSRLSCRIIFNQGGTRCDVSIEYALIGVVESGRAYDEPSMLRLSLENRCQRPRSGLCASDLLSTSFCRTIRRAYNSRVAMLIRPSFIVFSLTVCCLVPQAFGKDAAPLIARVNGVGIPHSALTQKFEKMTLAFKKRGKTVPKKLATRYRATLLRQLVDAELLAQAVKSQGIVISASQMAAEFAHYKSVFREEANFQRYLKTTGKSLKSIKRKLQMALAVERLLTKRGQLAVSDGDVRAFYDANHKRYTLKEKIRARHILRKVSANATPEQQASAKKKALEIYQKAIAPGADFAALARQFSEGPSQARGGDLGLFGRGRMVPEFEDIAFTLKVNEIPKPIKTQFGWHVVQVTEKIKAGLIPYTKVKEAIRKKPQKETNEG